MTGTTIISSVWRAPSPSAVPTAVPTSSAATEPAAIGTNNFKNPLIRMWRSMLRMLPTITAAMNRYRKLLDLVNSVTACASTTGIQWWKVRNDGMNVAAIAAPPMLRITGKRWPISAQVKPMIASTAIIVLISVGTLPTATK